MKKQSTSYKSQQKVKDLNRAMVLNAIKEGKTRFKELKSETNLSPMGLTGILSDIEKTGLVKRRAVGRWNEYVLTAKGENKLSAMSTMGFAIDKIITKGGQSHYDYSLVKHSMDTQGLPWGIRDFLVLDKNINEQNNPLYPELIGAINMQLFRELKKVIDNKIIDIDKLKGNQIILGFILDVDDLIKSIKQDSLAAYNTIAGNEEHSRPKDKLEQSQDEFSEFAPIK